MKAISIRHIIIPAVVIGMLCIPLVAMQFTQEVQWNLLDFVVAGVLLSATALLVEMAIRKIAKPVFRITVVSCVLLGLLLVWAELAVGLFGTILAGS